MAKKSFKGGLGSLLENTREITQNLDTEKAPKQKPESSGDSKNVKQLNDKILRLQEELRQWRTGLLTVELFHETLKEHKLKYIESTNSFEKEE